MLNEEANKKKSDPANQLLEKMKENMRKMELEKNGGESPTKDKEKEEVKQEEIKIPDVNILVYK